MSKEFNEEQNKEEYLRYRYVYRKLYTNEKKYRNIISLAGIVGYILGLFNNISEFLFIVPIVWLIISEIIKRRLTNIHKKAVDYHEYIDREMFGLSKLIKLIDNHNSLNQEAINIITQESEKKKYKEMIEENHKISIRNWYNDFKEIPFNIAVIMAQDENVNWEKNQRKIYRVVLGMLLIFILSISAIIVYLITNNLIFIVYVIPIAWDFISLFLDNNEAIKRCNSLTEKIGEVYNQIKHEGKMYDHNEIFEASENIQLKIYENRKDSIPVPDLIYKIFRGKLQEKSDLYTKEIKKDIINNLEK